MNKIPEKESLTIEFKGDVSPVLSDDDIVDVVVGFANTNGGDLYIGVEDDGSVTGLHSSRTNVIGIAAMIANKTIPSVSVRVEILKQNEHHYLKIEVPKSQTIIANTNGKILRRRIKHDNTPETIPFYPHEINSRLTELSRLDYSAQTVPNATYNDLDPIERERLRKLILTHNGDTKLLELTDEELDKSLQFVKSEGDKLIPTITGLLLIGKSDSLKNHLPTARIAFQVMEGTNIRINEDITVPLLAAFEIIEEYMKAWNPEREIQSGLFRIPITEFDNSAIREALVNALSHRDYTRIGRVRILIDDDGLTISNPGGFIEGVTLTNLLTVEPHGRNPALADALKRLGLAERTGRGIDRIYEGSLIYGRPWPDYAESNTTMVKLFIQRAMPDTAFTRMILEEKNRLGRNLPVTSLLILSSLKDERRATTHQIAEKIHLSESKTKSALEQLSEAGLIETRGEGRGRTYMLSSKVYQKTSSLIEYVRQTDIDHIRHPHLIMQYVETKGSITRQETVELLHLSESQAYRLLKKMVFEDKLTLSGRGRGAKYLPNITGK